MEDKRRCEAVHRNCRGHRGAAPKPHHRRVGRVQDTRCRFPQRGRDRGASPPGSSGRRTARTNIENARLWKRADFFDCFSLVTIVPFKLIKSTPGVSRASCNATENPWEDACAQRRCPQLPMIPLNDPTDSPDVDLRCGGTSYAAQQPPVRPGSWRGGFAHQSAAWATSAAWAARVE